MHMNKKTIELVSDDPRFVALLKEYELLFQRFSQSEERFSQIINWVVAILTTVAGIVLGPTGLPLLSGLSSWLAWVAPFIAVFLFFILLWQFYQLEGYIRRCRITAEQINHRFGETVLTQFSPNAKTTSFFSSRHGNIKSSTVFWVLIGLSAILYVVTIAVSLLSVYRENHLAGFILSALVTTISFLLVFSLLGVISDLPKYYDEVYEIVRETGKVPQSETGLKTLRPFQQGLKSLHGILLPRRNLAEKGVIFLYGFIGALVLIGIQPSQVDLINRLFRQDTDYTADSVPFWSVCALGFVYFSVSELLLQQAKYLWNDMRDRDRDQKSPYHQDRAYTQGLLTSQEAMVHVILRWTLAFILGYLLGGWQLLALFGFVSIHQILYVFWGKPSAENHPLRLLFLLSFNIPPRFIAGVMAVAGTSWVTIPILVLSAIFHFFSFGFMAAYWKMEAVYIDNNPQLDLSERPQSKFFLKVGDRWQRHGFISAVISSLILLMSYSLIDQSRLSSAWYFPLTLSLLLAIHAFTFMLFRAFSRLGRQSSTITSKIQAYLMLISYAIFGLGLLYSVLETRPIVYITAILFMNVGALFMYERMKWEELTGEEMRRQIPDVLRLWIAYFFVPPEVLAREWAKISTLKPTLGGLVSITLSVLNNETVFPKNQDFPRFF